MEKLKIAAPYAAMVVAQTAQVGLIIVSKEAMSNGMSNFIFVSYSNALAALILLPVSFFIHRSSWSGITFKLVGGFFLLGVLGCTAQITGYVGIDYTSASFSTAMLNLIPGFTFVLAALFRMEKVDFTTPSTIAKSAGTLVSIAGAFILTLYKGPKILPASLSSSSQYKNLYELQSNWILGGLFLSVDCFVASMFTIVQAFILKGYPAELIMVFFYCCFAAILSTGISLISGSDLSAWTLQPRMRLFSVLYSGIFGSALQVSLITWSVHKKGPLFVAMFHPLGIVIAAAFNIIISKDPFFLGSLVGSIVIVVGFYSVMWGKAKEIKVAESHFEADIAADPESFPLLRDQAK
ncbi:OLC1v1028201C1 [Oldenlandia corymbosa var. corymbosa]|uniref:WAT1-related protein n=1 Tax=Oldenlandia corymbosa var. corymbosa TaxID=529605 RepID=A0AAV1CDX9_OLDCO|nr:OLC1v1028201C1 [Oldenlandia corymbosa var. corymbosa]